MVIGGGVGWAMPRKTRYAHATPEQKAARLAYGAMKQREFKARQKRKAMG
jgi:hypothetical protein